MKLQVCIHTSVVFVWSNDIYKFICESTNFEYFFGNKSFFLHSRRMQHTRMILHTYIPAEKFSFHKKTPQIRLYSNFKKTYIIIIYNKLLCDYGTRVWGVMVMVDPPWLWWILPGHVEGVEVHYPTCPKCCQLSWCKMINCCTRWFSWLCQAAVPKSR